MGTRGLGLLAFPYYVGYSIPTIKYPARLYSIAMVLRCNCGGALEITSQSYNDNGGFESYECASCGRTGGYDLTTNTTSGCVVDA